MYTAVQISSGTGPEEVRCFVGKLGCWFEHYSRRLALPVRAVEVVGEPQMPRSLSILIAGNATAKFSGLTGTHMLVARSARRGRNGRKRWFAGVGIYTGEQEESAATIPSSEIRVSVARAGGPGGQHVNTTSSAVRILHVPSGVSVRVASERSQHQNRSEALRRLATALAARQRDAQRGEKARRRLSHYQFERGLPVCTWHLGQRTGELMRA